MLVTGTSSASASFCQLLPRLVRCMHVGKTG